MNPNSLNTPRRIRPILLSFGLTLMGFLPSCSGKVVKIDSLQPAKVSLRSIEDINKAGKALGAAPVSVPIEDIQGKVIVVKADNFAPIHWIVTDAVGDTSKISLDFTKIYGSSDESQAGTSGGISKNVVNRIFRLVLAGYQSLTNNRLEDAIAFANQAAKIDEQLAAPLIIRGIAQLKIGNKGAAKQSFLLAQTLDPEDKNIDKLLNALSQ